MEQAQRKGLLSLSNKISADISPDKVTQELLSQGILHQIQVDDMRKLKTSKLRSARLIELLTSCGPKAFGAFYDVLMKQGHRKIAFELRKVSKENKGADENGKEQQQQKEQGKT